MPCRQKRQDQCCSEIAPRNFRTWRVICRRQGRATLSLLRPTNNSPTRRNAAKPYPRRLRKARPSATDPNCRRERHTLDVLAGLVPAILVVDVTHPSRRMHRDIGRDDPPTIGGSVTTGRKPGRPATRGRRSKRGLRARQQPEGQCITTRVDARAHPWWSRGDPRPPAEEFEQVHSLRCSRPTTLAHS